MSKMKAEIAQSIVERANIASENRQKFKIGQIEFSPVLDTDAYSIEARNDSFTLMKFHFGKLKFRVVEFDVGDEHTYSIQVMGGSYCFIDKGKFKLLK